MINILQEEDKVADLHQEEAADLRATRKEVVDLRHQAIPDSEQSWNISVRVEVRDGDEQRVIRLEEDCVVSRRRKMCRVCSPRHGSVAAARACGTPFPFLNFSIGAIRAHLFKLN